MPVKIRRDLTVDERGRGLVQLQDGSMAVALSSLRVSLDVREFGAAALFP